MSEPCIDAGFSGEGALWLPRPRSFLYRRQSGTIVGNVSQASVHENDRAKDLFSSGCTPNNMRHSGGVEEKRTC
mgnify:CR=1 FL=1